MPVAKQNHNLTRLIERLKVSESLSDIALVVHDACLQRLLRVWPAVHIMYSETETNAENDLEMRLLWDGVQVDLEELAALAHIPRPMIACYFKQAKLLHLIYPDGTINAPAERFLNSLLSQQLIGLKVASKPSTNTPVRKRTRQSPQSDSKDF